jgi:hypothetical protein
MPCVSCQWSLISGSNVKWINLPRGGADELGGAESWLLSVRGWMATVRLILHPTFGVRCTSRKRVFGPTPKYHLSWFGSPIGTNDRHWSWFVPFGGRSRFILGNRSRFMAWTETNASPAWHVALCGALVPVHGMNRDQRPSPGYKLISSPLPQKFAGLCVRCTSFFFLWLHTRCSTKCLCHI